MKPRNRYEEYRYVAYDAHNCEHEEFKTLKEAEDWLTENDGEGITEEAVNGQNYIAEIQYRSVVTVTGEKKDYCEYQCDDCPLDNPEDCDKEEWPCSSEFDWMGDHHYERMEYEESDKQAF